jgi:hypothetical protein
LGDTYIKAIGRERKSYIYIIYVTYEEEYHMIINNSNNRIIDQQAMVMANLTGLAFIIIIE